MIKNKLTFITILGFMTILISCKSSTSNNESEQSNIDKKQDEKTSIEAMIKDESSSEGHTQFEVKASEFAMSLKAGEKLSSFFNDSWLFIYHEDNRCDGSTDGQTNKLPSEMIDSIIKLQVKNDGNGWACDKKEPKTYDMEFYLRNRIADWDRFEIPNYKNQEMNIIYLEGAGVSDYIKLHYNNNNLIVKFEYRSEDPG